MSKQTYTQDDILNAINAIEDDDTANDKALFLKSWQTLIDTGVVWQLQGAYGRTASHLIEAGICRPPVTLH